MRTILAALTLAALSIPATAADDGWHTVGTWQIFGGQRCAPGQPCYPYSYPQRQSPNVAAQQQQQAAAAAAANQAAAQQAQALRSQLERIQQTVTEHGQHISAIYERLDKLQATFDNATRTAEEVLEEVEQAVAQGNASAIAKTEQTTSQALAEIRNQLHAELTAKLETISSQQSDSSSSSSSSSAGSGTAGGVDWLTIGAIATAAGLPGWAILAGKLAIGTLGALRRSGSGNGNTPTNGGGGGRPHAGGSGSNDNDSNAEGRGAPRPGPFPGHD